MCDVYSGYLIVKTFERMYREFWKPFEANEVIYSIPRKGVPPESYEKKYRGSGRDPLQPWIEQLRDTGVVEPTDNELEASLFLNDLDEIGKSKDDFVFSLDDVRELLSKIHPPIERDIIWAARCDKQTKKPENSFLLGYEPTWFYPSDHFSAIADCMCFPRWHGCDLEGTLFKSYHEGLNEYGLYPTQDEAKSYLDFYLSHDWTEHGEYYFAEIRSVKMNI